MINHFKDFWDSFIGCLNLSITLWILCGGSMMLGMLYIIEVLDILVLEWGVIMGENGGENCITIDDVI